MVATDPPTDTVAALHRWLVQLRDPEDPAYTYIRRIEHGFDAKRCDNGNTLRGVQLAQNLVMTRQLMFFQLIGRKKTHALSLEDVAAQYVVDDLREVYRKAMDIWKAAQKKRAS